MSVITSASFSALAMGYARRDLPDPGKWPDVADVMTRVTGTSCCVQLSRAFGGAGLVVPERSYRRKNEYFKTRGWFSLLAVDEVEEFLTVRYGEGEDFSPDPSLVKAQASQATIRQATQTKLSGKTGVLVFRHAPRRLIPQPGLFEHTELWDGTKILQQDMNQDALFSSPRVFFWSTNDAPSWLTSYMGS